MKHANNFAMKMPIEFPFLICGVILNQHPNILNSSDTTCKRESPLSLQYRLFTRKHVQDIVMTSGKNSSKSTSNEGITAKLKYTCKALDETIKSCTKKKITLKSLTKAL